MSTFKKYPTTVGNLEATVKYVAGERSADLAVVKQLVITFHMSTKLCVWSNDEVLVHRIRLKDIGLDTKVRLNQFLDNSVSAVSYYTPGFVWVSTNISKKDLTNAAEAIRVEDDHDVSYNQWIELRQEAIPKTPTSEGVVGKVYNLRRSFIDNIVFVDCCAPATSTSPLVPGQVMFDYKDEKIVLYYKTRNAAETGYLDLLEAIPY